jgi:uncharacterized protein involved in exopolysaccharide biosynthesis
MSGLASSSSQNTTESSLRGMAESLFRHRRRFLAVFCFGLLLTLVYVFLSHKKYESNMSLLVQNARKPEIISAEATTGSQAAVNAVTEEDLYSQVEILGSADVLDEVVDPGWRNVPITSHSKAAQKDHEDKVYRFRKHLEVAPVRKSHVIDVSYIANDPREATDMLNRLLSIFLAREQEITQPGGASHFFNEEANRYQSQWADAQRRLADFQQTHHIVSISDRETELGTAIASTMILQRAAEAEAGEVSHRLDVESTQKASTPVRQETIERTLPAAGSIDQVNTLLAQLTLKRAQLLTEYLPTDRLVQQVDTQISEAETELAKSQAMNSREVSTNVNPTWQALDQSIADDKAHLRAVNARLAVINSQVADLESQLRSTEHDTLEFTSLQQNAAELQTNYQLYLQKRDAAQISEAMDKRGLINIGIAQSPTFSLTPARPRPVIDTLLGLITSFFLASFAVYLAESGRQTVATPAELDAASRYPTLATIGLGTVGAKDQYLPAKAVRSIIKKIKRRAASGRSKQRS